MKNFWKLFGIIVFITVIGFTMTACKEKDNDDDDDVDNIDDSVITVSQLPDFPSDSNPVMTEEAAQAVLAELKASEILFTLMGEVEEVFEANMLEIDDEENWNVSFSDKSLPEGFVRVSIPSFTANTTRAGGFITLDEFSKAGKAYDNIQFAVGDKENSAWSLNIKGELIKAKTEKGVTVAQGSTITDEKTNSSSSVTVTTAGLYNEFKVNHIESGKNQTIRALTVATSSGSVKIIFEFNHDYNLTANNIKLWGETTNLTEKVSGSLKVYGGNNTLLIDYPITDWESYGEANHMFFGYN